MSPSSPPAPAWARPCSTGTASTINPRLRRRSLRLRPAHATPEIDLLRYLRDRFDGHVSYERVLSGPGYFNVYGFLRETGYHPETPTCATDSQGQRGAEHHR